MASALPLHYQSIHFYQYIYLSDKDIMRLN